MTTQNEAPGEIFVAGRLAYIAKAALASKWYIEDAAHNRTFLNRRGEWVEWIGGDKNFFWWDTEQEAIAFARSIAAQGAVELSAGQPIPLTNHHLESELIDCRRLLGEREAEIADLKGSGLYIAGYRRGEEFGRAAQAGAPIAPALASALAPAEPPAQGAE